MNVEELSFDASVGDFHFSSGRMRLELWEEYSKNSENRDRSWLVESGERIVFNDVDYIDQTPVHCGDTPYSSIIELRDSLNELVAKKKATEGFSGWPEDVEAEGKLFFYNEYDDSHNVVVMLHWKNGEFIVTHRDFE